MNNWTIGKRITFGFATVLLIMLALSIFVRLRIGVINTGTVAVARENIPGLELVADAQAAAANNQTLTYKHIYSSDAADMDQIESKITANTARVNKDFDGYEAVASPDGKAILKQARTLLESYRTVRVQILTASRSATNATQSAVVYQKARTELDPAAETFISALEKCAGQESKDADESAESMLGAVSSASLGLWVGLGLAVISAGVLGFFIIRNTTGILSRISATLSDGAGQVASAAGQVTASSQSLAEGSSEQAASVEETSSSLEETASMTKRNAENAQKANDLAKQARTAAERGAGDMQAMSSAMQSIKSSSDDVAKIIKTIDEIAFQTNILALNAAVEAARAGEAGMGFAVVADEVRNLAQRSAQAAKETAAKIEGAITSTTQGVQLSAKVADTLGEIVAKVRQVDDLVSEVASASKEQTTGIVQINAAVGQMDKVTQSNAASAEECAAAAEELNAQAATMKHAVGELTRLVTSSAVAPAGTPRAAAGSSRPPATTPRPHSHGNTNGNGNGKFASAKTPAKHTSSAASVADRRQDIPLEDAFKDF